MTDSDTPRLVKFLAVLAEMFGEPMSDIRLEAYFVALEDVPIVELEAVMKAALNGRFFPRPGDLRELIAPGEWNRQRELERMRSHLRLIDANKKALES